MKLARVDHYRCGEPADWRSGGGTTYVWIPDDWDEPKLQAAVDSARSEYLETERKFKALSPVPPPGYGATILPTTPDDLTVGQLKAEYEKKSKAYKEYQEMVSRARKPFAFYLKEVSGSVIKTFWEEEPSLKVECDWGHNHGLVFEYSPTKITDFPTPPSEEGDDYL